MDGILIIDKPKGMTSHDVINVLRKKYHQKKFGHTGVLDPEATGVLVVMCGKATKVLQFLSNTDKRYIAEIEFGISTTTDDIYGEVTQKKEINMDYDFDAVLQSFVGACHQRVPMTSNKRVNGKKLIQYQRKGQEVGPVYQDIEIYEMKKINDTSFEVYCSSGTYVRSICRDIGEKTNNLACMKSLRRTQVGNFTIEQAQDIDDEPVLYSIASVLEHIYPIHLDDCLPVYQGKHLCLNCDEKQVCIYDKEEPIAIYEKGMDGFYHSKRGLW